MQCVLIILNFFHRTFRNKILTWPGDFLSPLEGSKGVKTGDGRCATPEKFFSLVFFFRNKAAELGAWFEREVEGPLAGKARQVV